MADIDDRRDRLVPVCLLASMVLLGCVLSLLSRGEIIDLLGFLVVWACLSVPLAVLVGHCILGED